MNRYLPIFSGLGIITAITLQPQSVLAALEPTEIYAKAREFTVQIDGEETGTGTIIERNNDTYTVITCWHVMDTPGNYQITTPDGNTHQVTNVENLPDIDLAIVTFNSSNAYSTAELGDSTQATSGLDAYVVGYPDPFPGVPERQYFTDSAEVQSRLTQGENGYQIIHDGSFTPGSSGGGIFDNQARLIGINGQFISEGNTGKTYGAGIPLEIYLAATGNFATPANVLPPQDFVSIGKRKLQQEDYSGAIEEFNRALASNPNDLEALLGRGTAYYILKDFNTALGDFNTVLQGNPDNLIALFGRGTIYGELGKNEEEIADYDKAIQLDSSNVFKVLAYNNRGVSYEELRQYEKAIADYTEAIKLDPEYAEAYRNRGNSYREIGEYEQAIADYTEAIRFNPEYTEAYYNRGVTHSQTAKYEQAIADYTEAIRLNPEYTEAYYNRGFIYDEIENHQQAIADYTEAIRLNPKLSAAYHNRGVSYSQLENYEQAIADYTEAIRLNPEYAEAYYSRGINHSQLENYEQAIADCTEAIRLNPELTGAYGIRALSYDKLGKTREAIESYQQAANLLQQQGNIELYNVTIERIRELQ